MCMMPCGCPCYSESDTESFATPPDEFTPLMQRKWFTSPLTDITNWTIESGRWRATWDEAEDPAPFKFTCVRPKVFLGEFEVGLKIKVWKDSSATFNGQFRFGLTNFVGLGPGVKFNAETVWDDDPGIRLPFITLSKVAGSWKYGGGIGIGQPGTIDPWTPNTVSNTLSTPTFSDGDELEIRVIGEDFQPEQVLFKINGTTRYDATDFDTDTFKWIRRGMGVYFHTQPGSVITGGTYDGYFEIDDFEIDVA